LSFVILSWSRITDKLAINWQNFTPVQLQLKFALIIRPWYFVGYTGWPKKNGPQF